MCCTNGAGPSGARVKEDRHSPSTSALFKPLASSRRARARPSHQVALRSERRTYGSVTGQARTMSP